MSAETLRELEAAIKAHLESTFDEETSEDRRSSVVIDWVVGYTISNIIDLDGKSVVGYKNDYVSSDSNPNGQAHLAQWVSNQIAYALEPPEDD